MGGFKSFLKMAGEVMANGLLTQLGLPPIFKPEQPPAGVLGAVGSLQRIADSAIEIERIGKTLGLTGTQKMQALQPRVFAILQESLALEGDPMGDPVLCKKGADGIAQGIIDFMNGLKSKGIPDNGTPIPVENK